ncbi:Potassium transporter [Stygiomarasmius scandens]|uniref:Potassium transporter n=1 Tax=Marasmiellus scandens TaxID=2682957 RepID=A0ABR1K2K2_9AGAR
MCWGGPKWKREIVPDHKFDFVDTREFTDNGFMMRMKYLWLYIIVLKSFLVYISDIFTAITMLTTSSWRNEIFNSCADLGCVSIPYNVGKWLFVGCIIFSFLLLGYESRKAKKIIASRDISYAFTNVMANNYYSLRSYDHFCFFDHISNSTKTSDDFAFFVFFTFKSWKRLLLADGPRQTINALTLYAIFVAHKKDPGDWWDVQKYFKGNSLSTSALTVTTCFTVAVFAGSLLLLIVAGICYVPLLMHIRGNLKEYCCHKVDKRISAVIKRKQKQRLADVAKLARKEAMGDYSHLKNKKGEIVGKPLPQPTLPNLSVDDDFDDAASMRTRGPPPSTYTQDYYSSDQGGYPPPMPAYNPYSQHTGSFTQINPSQPTLRDDSLYNYTPQGYYEDDNDSVAHLAGTAAPFAGQGQSQGLGADPNSYPNPYSPGPGNTSYDPHDVYQGHAAMSSPAPDASRRWSPSHGAAPGYEDYRTHTPGHAYDDYRSHTPGHAYDDYRSHTPANANVQQSHYGQGNGYGHGPAGGYAV